MKICKECGTKKVAADFYKHKAMTDGRLNKCIECVRLRVAQHRTKNLSRIRRHDRERAKNPERMRQITSTTKHWRKQNPEKYKAQTAVNNAVRDGRINRPKKCEECTMRKKLHGHHNDYSKPLEVEWLCAACHKKRHTGE